MKLMKNEKYLQQNFSPKVLLPETAADSTLRVSMSYVPFTCKSPMVTHFALIFHKRCILILIHYVCNAHFHWLWRRKFAAFKIIAFMP